MTEQEKYDIAVVLDTLDSIVKHKVLENDTRERLESSIKILEGVLK